MSCPVVRIMPSHPSQGAFVEINESDFDATRHVLYVEAVAAPVAAPPPLPPLPPPGPLGNLPKNWRDGKTAELKALAARVTGRTCEDRPQAIAMIEAALSK